MVVDTSALMCILLGEPETEDYANALVKASHILIGAPTWVETALVATARLGEPGHALLLELLTRLRVETVPWDEALAHATYEAWLAYGRGRHPAALNFGDCFAYALAKKRGEPLLFKGDDFTKTDIPSGMELGIGSAP